MCVCVSVSVPARACVCITITELSMRNCQWHEYGKNTALPWLIPINEWFVLCTRDSTVKDIGLTHHKKHIRNTVTASSLKQSNSVPINGHFFPQRNSPSRPGPPHRRRFTITLRHITLIRTHLGEWSVRRKDLYLTTHDTHKRQTDIHSFSEFRTHGGSKLVVSDPRLWAHGHWGRHTWLH